MRCRKLLILARVKFPFAQNSRFKPKREKSPPSGLRSKKGNLKPKTGKTAEREFKPWSLAIKYLILKYLLKKESKMPIINVKMTKENGGLSKAEKEELASELSKAFVRVVGRGESTCVVTIEELSTDNYAIGGQTITNIRKQNK